MILPLPTITATNIAIYDDVIVIDPNLSNAIELLHRSR